MTEEVLPERRLIFLDIDGVMNSRRSMEEMRKQGNPYLFDPEAMRQLNRIIAQTGAEVVISSTWRHGWKIAQLRKHFEDQGFIGTIIDYTPTRPYNRTRGQEILEWLQESSSKNKKQKIRFVIIDDDTDMEPLMKHLVRTSMRTGLTELQAGIAIDRLKGVTW